MVDPQNRRTRARSRRREFADLYFGMAAAENEVAADPDRFLETYYDRWDLPSQVLRHERFLILGPKGSGKSAASRYMAMRWQSEIGRECVFSRFVDFDNLNRTQSPLTSLDKRLVSEIPAMTDAAWRLFLGVRLLESLTSDPACSLTHEPRALRLLAELKSAGLASDDYPNVLRRVRERKGTFSIARWVGGEASYKDGDTLSPGQVGDAILDLILNAQTTNRHLLVIDGLDKAIGDNEAYWQTLAALIRVADGIRRHLQTAGIEHTFVVVLCRSDVFRRVQSADAPKIAADGGTHMEWSAEAKNPRDVLLWNYIAHKAGVTTDRIFDLLPSSVPVGGGGVATDKYLLSFTRYTPRDMTLLFKSMQERATNPRGPSREEVRAAADQFASRHLLAEIISESVGLLPSTVVSALEQILSGLPGRYFTKDDLSQSMQEAGISDAITLKTLGEYLFLQGAIGNYRQQSDYVQFYHRRDAYKFQSSGPWILHTGLTYAFNLPWNRL